MHQDIVAKKEPMPVRTIERITILLTVVAMVGALFVSPTLAVFGGLISGTLVGLFILKLNEKLVSKIVSQDVQGQSGRGARFLIKLASFAIAIGFLLFYVKVSAAAFLVGFSTFVIATIYQGLKSLF